MGRFDLEQEIMKTWGIIDDIKDLITYMDKYGLNEDQIMNILIGLTELYHPRFETVFEGFEEMCYREAENRRI